MAKTKTSSIKAFLAKTKKKRPGIHAKSKFSKLKSSKFYKKISRGQG